MNLLSFSLLSFLLFFTLSLFPKTSYSAVIGIDFGSDTYKVALVKAGKVDIVENEDSRRKTVNLISFYRGERLFGDAGFKRLTKNPETSFKFLNGLLGKKYSGQESPRNLFPLVEDEKRHTISVSVDDQTYSVEELVAMILEKAKQQTAYYSGTLVKDVAITVPPFWTHSQRQALLDAARLAGLNVLSLINEDTAVAMNYALMKDVTNETKIVLFFDMGETSTKVSIVGFKTVTIKDKKTKKPVKMPSIQVLGYGWDDSLGGNDFDSVLALELANRVEKKLKKEIKSNNRVMALLLKESNRVKEVLSANTETYAQVEGLIDEYNMKELVTRSEFEELAKPLFERILPPIQSAMQFAEVTKEDLEAFEMIGGNHRIPKILSILEEFLGKTPDRHLNADEAAVFGATFYGAHLHPYVKIQDVKVKELNTYQIDAKITSSGEELLNEYIFPNTIRISSQTGVKKSLNFNPTSLEPFKVLLSYNDPRFPSSFPKEIVEYTITGLDQLEGVEYDGDITVSVFIRLTPSGTVSFDSSEARVNVSVPIQENKEETEGTEGTEGTVEEKTEESEKNEESLEEKPEEESEGASELKADEPVGENNEPLPLKEKRFRLTLGETHYFFNHLDESSFLSSSKKLEELNTQDKLRKEREEAVNRLESFVYEMKDKLDSNDEYLEVSTQDERDKIIEELNFAGDWIYEEGSEASVSEFRTKLQKLNQSLSHIELRRREKVFRPESASLLRRELERARLIMVNITTHLEVTEEQKQDFLNTCDEYEKWLEDKEIEQSTKSLTEEPAFLSSEVIQKYTSLSKSLKRLTFSPKRKPKVEKPEKIETQEPSLEENTEEKQNEEKEQTVGEGKTETEELEDITKEVL